eukprot:2148917-Prymnesium_polylepis.2
MVGQARRAHIKELEADLRRVLDVARVFHLVDVVERLVRRFILRASCQRIHSALPKKQPTPLKPGSRPLSW